MLPRRGDRFDGLLDRAVIEHAERLDDERRADLALAVGVAVQTAVENVFVTLGMLERKAEGGA